MAVKRYRRFWLEDQDGELVSLNGENRIWFSEPEGMGFEDDAKYAGNNGGFFLRSGSGGDRQATPGFKLVFTGPDPYRDYRFLMDWALGAKELLLVYMPGKQTDAFRRRVELVSVGKGELNGVGWLECPVSLAVLTPWFTTHAEEAEVTASGAEPFRAGVDRAGADRLSSGFEYTSSVTLYPGGHLPAALFLTHSRGTTLAAPVITVTGAVTGREYGRCAVNWTMGSAGTFEYSAEPNNSYVRARVYSNRDGRLLAERDLMPYVDLAFEPFPALPTNEPAVITMTTASRREGVMKVTARQYRRTV